MACAIDPKIAVAVKVEKKIEKKIEKKVSKKVAKDDEEEVSPLRKVFESIQKERSIVDVSLVNMLSEAKSLSIKGEDRRKALVGFDIDIIMITVEGCKVDNRYRVDVADMSKGLKSYFARNTIKERHLEREIKAYEDRFKQLGETTRALEKELSEVKSKRVIYKP